MDDKVTYKKSFKQNLVDCLPIIYFIIVTLICAASIAAFFISLNKFGPTIASSTLIATLFFTVITVILMKKIEKNQLFNYLTVLILFLTAAVTYVTNLVMFVF